MATKQRGAPAPTATKAATAENLAQRAKEKADAVELNWTPPTGVLSVVTNTFSPQPVVFRL